MNSESPWAESAQHFQQIFGQSWAQALESFQKLDTGAKTPAPAPLKLSQTKLQALQQQYLKEAGELWAQGVQGKPDIKDKRFVGDGWANNPVAAFSAAAYVSTRGPGSIIGDEVLDFQVRNGTGYFHFSIATSKVECKK